MRLVMAVTIAEAAPHKQNLLDQQTHALKPAEIRH